jgi:hypothetical protein
VCSVRENEASSIISCHVIIDIPTYDTQVKLILEVGTDDPRGWLVLSKIKRVVSWNRSDERYDPRCGFGDDIILKHVGKSPFCVRSCCGGRDSVGLTSSDQATSYLVHRSV